MMDSDSITIDELRNIQPRYFGQDPVDFRYCVEHPHPRFVSEFVISPFVKNFGRDFSIHYLVSWSNALRFRRFLNIFPDIVYSEYSLKVDYKLIRFDLDRYYKQLKDDFNLDSTYDDISWNDLDDSGIVRLRSKKSNK